MICKKCQKEIDDDSKFCEFCQNKISNGYGEAINQVLKEERDPQKEITVSALEQLNAKMWYRALKVLYFLGIALGIVVSLGVAIDEEDPIAFFVLFLITLIISEIIKRSFYYISLGKVFPKKKT